MLLDCGCTIILSAAGGVIIKQCFAIRSPQKLPGTIINVWYSSIHRWVCRRMCSNSFLFDLSSHLDAIRTKRSSLVAPRSNVSADDKEEEPERKKKINKPGVGRLHSNALWLRNWNISYSFENTCLLYVCMFKKMILWLRTGTSAAGVHVLWKQQRHRDGTRGNRKHFSLAAKDPDLQSQEERLRSGFNISGTFLLFFSGLICSNKLLRPQSTGTRRPWREATWRSPCRSWITTNTMCFHIWRTAGGFRSTTCRPSEPETDSVWV